MSTMVTKMCNNCSKSMKVRQTDLNRGWGKFCSKSCKAKDQYRRNKNPTSYDEVESHPFSAGYYGHGQN